MQDNNENISKNGWSEYGRLVLNELKRLNDGQDSLKKDLEQKFNALNDAFNKSNTGFENTKKDVDDLSEWKEKVTEVWSTTQMKEAKDQIYRQKGYFQKAIGVLVTIQVILTLISIFSDYLFK